MLTFGIALGFPVKFVTIELIWCKAVQTLNRATFACIECTAMSSSIELLRGILLRIFSACISRGPFSVVFDREVRQTLEMDDSIRTGSLEMFKGYLSKFVIPVLRLSCQLDQDTSSSSEKFPEAPFTCFLPPPLLHEMFRSTRRGVVKGGLAN